MKTNPLERRARRGRSEASFSLIETVIALAIVSFLIMEVAAVQGNSIVFGDYGRNVTQAGWLAKRVMSQVEYYWRTKPFKDLETSVVEQKFEDFDEYSYSLEIKEWKFPFTQLIQQVLGGDDKDKKATPGDTKEADPGGKPQVSGDMIEQVVKQIFGDEPIFMTAHVEVSWPEGAQRNSTSMEYLLTNQAKLDEFLGTLKPVYDKLTKPPAKKTNPNDPKRTPPGQPNPNGTQPPNDGSEPPGGA
jgi:type II secretory pathway pseudopilin PulG